MVAAVKRVQAVYDGLTRIGYPPDNIEREYLFTVRNGHAKTYRADLVAFAEPEKHDLDTACIAADVIDDVHLVRPRLETLQTLAGPFALLLGPTEISVWPVGPTLQRHAAETVAYEDLAPYLSRRDYLFGPPNALRAKSAGLQLDIFSIGPGLIHFARQVTRTVLVDQFRLALSLASQALKSPTAGQQTILTRYAVRALAAAVLEDKEALGGGRADSALALFRKAARTFGSFFSDSDYHLLGESVAEGLLRDLREGVTFRSFSTEDLGHFYEYALSDESQRRALGIYYTPHTVANRILDALPVERLAPSRRSVFDGTCGSGSLLLAAHRRLSGLLPSEFSTPQRHAYLVQMIEGLDQDAFATDLSKLALFLTDLPSSDGWRVQTGDFHEWPIKTDGYGIVVANPPFIFDRGQAPANQELANRMLSRYLDCLAPDGLLGIIMPESFAVSNAARDVRARLLSKCKVIELWHLPEKIFSGSAVATVVLLAERNARTLSAAVRVIRVGPSKAARDAFEFRGIPDVSFVENAQTWLEDPDHRLSNSPVSHLFTHLENAVQLSDVAQTANGIIPRRKAKLSKQAVGNRFRPWLDGAKRIRPFHISWDDQEFGYIEWPGELWRPRTQLRQVFETASAKVLVNASRNSASPWRVSAAVDRIGLFPAQGVHLIYPKTDKISVEELAAILNGSVANAWLDARTRMRWINERVLGDLPLPEFDEGQRQDVINLVRQAEKLPFTKSSDLFARLDDIISDAYHLDAEGRQAVRQFMYASGRTRFDEAPAETHINGNEPPNFRVSGHVLGIDAQRRFVTLWVRGVTPDGGVETPIPPAMPGWALLEGASFQAELEPDRRAHAVDSITYLRNFRPIDFSYLSDDELDRVMVSPAARASLYSQSPGGDPSRR